MSLMKGKEGKEEGREEGQEGGWHAIGVCGNN